MGSASRYWQLVRIDTAGRRKVEEIASAKLFIQQQFSVTADEGDALDSLIQKELLNLLQEGRSAASDMYVLAECCLRCFISHQIELVCIQLEQQFGSQYGFTRYDLFPLVLDDDGQLYSSKPSSSQYRSLSREILQTFDPNRAGLSTWTNRFVRYHPELSRFLREHGIYLASDWAILSDTSPDHLQRILLEFHNLTSTEIEQSYYLLQAYHLVYRQDRLQMRLNGTLKGKKQCLPPTPDQLARMAQYLQEQTLNLLSNEATMRKLQTLATQLRQYRIYVRGGTLPVQSLDQPETYSLAVGIQSPEQDGIQEEQYEFLKFYRKQFLLCLDQSIQHATDSRLAYLQRKSAQSAEQFVAALQLFHCQGQSMGEIASQIGLQAQYQVTRLVKLKEFRASVRQNLLLLLSDRILEKARTYVDTNQLYRLDQQLEAALNEQIDSVLQQAEAEAAVAKNSPLNSLFARRLCHYLDTQRAAV
jgi:hypothetical protein